MSKFPAWLVGKDVSATNLDAGIPNIVVKASANTMTSTTTLTNDSELSGISLAVGTWEIYMKLFANGVTGGRLKTAWAFTGTLSNTPVRSISGPGSANAAGPLAVTPSIIAGLAYNTATDYGLNTLTNPPYYLIEEECEQFVVSVAGNFSLQAAQTASSASATTIWPQSWVKLRQIG